MAKAKTVQKNNIEKTTIVSIRNVNVQTWYRIKVLAVEMDVTIGELLSQMLQAFHEKNAGKRK
jgi:hypothetical protein